MLRIIGRIALMLLVAFATFVALDAISRNNSLVDQVLPGICYSGIMLWFWREQHRNLRQNVGGSMFAPTVPMAFSIGIPGILSACMLGSVFYTPTTTRVRLISMILPVAIAAVAVIDVSVRGYLHNRSLDQRRTGRASS